MQAQWQEVSRSVISFIFEHNARHVPVVPSPFTGNDARDHKILQLHLRVLSHADRPQRPHAQYRAATWYQVLSSHPAAASLDCTPSRTNRELRLERRKAAEAAAAVRSGQADATAANDQAADGTNAADAAPLTDGSAAVAAEATATVAADDALERLAARYAAEEKATPPSLQSAAVSVADLSGHSAPPQVQPAPGQQQLEHHWPQQVSESIELAHVPCASRIAANMAPAAAPLDGAASAHTASCAAYPQARTADPVDEYGSGSLEHWSCAAVTASAHGTVPSHASGSRPQKRKRENSSAIKDGCIDAVRSS